MDSSALVKLVVPEPESERLLAHVAEGEAVSSALSAVEMPRAVARSGAGDEALAQVRRVLAALDIRRIDDEIIDAAARLQATVLRTLGAIHLATAIELGGELGELVAYDTRLLEAAAQHGITVASP